MIKAIEIAEREVGYQSSDKSSKYFDELFPDERPKSWCVPFIEWVFEKSYGEKEAKNKLHIDEYIQSVAALVNYFKQANKWHDKQAGIGWIIFIRTDNAYINHAEIVTYADREIVTSIGGNVGGRVTKTTRNRDDFHIAGYGEIDYNEGDYGS